MDRWLKRSRDKSSEASSSTPSDRKKNNFPGNLTNREKDSESSPGDLLNRENSSESSSENPSKQNHSRSESPEKSIVQLDPEDSEPPEKKTKRKQKFRSEYTQEWPCFVQSKLSTEYVFCSVCSKDLNISHGGRNDCVKHVKTAQHLKYAKASETKKDLKTYLKSSEEEEAVTRAELLFTNFIVEHNLPISCSDHAAPLFKKMFPDSKVASKYACGRTKTSSLIKCLSSSTQDSVVQCLKSGPFTLATDGSNDKNYVKLYPLVVSYYSKDLGKIINMILSIVECSDNTGQGIFNAITEEFEKKNIRWENCIAFASDNAKAMSGHIKGVISHIKRVQPDINFQGCVCHLLNIAAKKGCLSFKSFNVENFLVNIYYYLEKSSKRQHSFHLCQEIYGLKPHKILKYVSTRWLSLFECIKRVLEQWDPLIAFFCENEKDTKNSKLKEIQDSLKSPSTKAYLLFLKSALPLFVTANIFLQQEKPLIHLVRKTLEDLLVGVLARFIKPTAVDDSPSALITLDCSKRKNQKLDTDLVIGSDTRCHLKNMSSEDIANFYADAREFYLRSVNYLKKKLPVDDPFLQHAQIANISIKKSVSYSSVEFMVSKFPHVLSDEEKDNLEEEWSCFQFDDFSGIEVHEDRADAIWHQISLLCDANGTKKYKGLSKLILALLLVPHSNATSERVFSLVRKNQTDFRPTLGSETLTSLLVEKQKNFNLNTNCFESKFSKEFLSAAKKSTWLNICSSKKN